MKRYLTVLCSIVGCCVLFFSCGQPFSKVQIKAEPELYAPLGKKSLEVKEYLSAEKISELFGGSQSSLKAFDYVAGSQEDAMAFLVYYPLMEMDLDFNSYMKDLDMQDLSQAIPEMSFTVPSLAGITVEPQTLVVDGTDVVAGQTLNDTMAGTVNALIPQDGVPLMVEPRSISVDGEGLKSVTFADGNKIVLEITPTMENSSLVCVPYVYLKLPNGGKVDFVEKDGTYEADFAGKTISVGKIELEGYVTLQGTVQAGSVVGQEGIGAKVNVVSLLDAGFASATAEVPEGTEVSKTITHDLPETMTSMVSKINFEKAGVKLNLDNSLPAGNSLDITMSVPAFGINGMVKSVTAGTKELEFVEGNFDFVPSTNPSINVVMDVSLPGYNAAENTITVSNVVPGQTYGLAGTADVVAEWASATIKTEDPYEGSFPEDGEPIDMGDFMEKIPDGVKFKDVGADFYMNSSIQNMTLKGTVRANENYLLGSENDPVEIHVKDALVLPADGSSQWKEELPESSADLGIAMTDLLNSRPQSLSLEYSLEAEEITITKDDVAIGDKIKMELVLRLPLEFAINGDELPEGAEQGMKYVKFDIFKMADVYSDEPDANNDLFDRDEPSEPNEDIDELLSQVKTMTLEIEYNNQLGFETKAEFSDVKSGIKKFFDLDKGSGTVKISLDGDDVVKIKNAHPFEPRVFLYLPNTDEENPFMLKKDTNIEIKLFVVAVSDIDYTYELGGND